MIKLLPFILIPVLLIGGLAYFRFTSIKQEITPVDTTKEQTVESSPLEVPKTLPADSVEIRVKSLEDKVSKIAPTSAPNSSLDVRLKAVEGSLTDLLARISALEKSTPVAASSSKSATTYIPLGSNGGPWVNSDWTSLTEFQVTLDPANFPGYSNMVLELTSRMIESGAIGYVRLYNSSSASATSSEIKTITTSFGLYTSSTFTIPAGSKNYVLQVKSPDGQNLILQTARIRVNF